MDVASGKDLTTFIVHRDRVIKTSKLFRDAADAYFGHWEANPSMLVKLPRGSPSLFEIYTDWTSSGDLALGADRIIAWNQRHGLGFSWSLEACDLGDQLGDVEFQKRVLKILLQEIPTWSTSFLGALIEHLWKQPSSNALLRDFLLQWMVTKADGSWFAELTNRAIPREFFAEFTPLAPSQITAHSDAVCQHLVRVWLEDR